MSTKEIRHLRQERTIRKLNGEVVVKPPRIIVRESAAVIPIIVENLPEIAEGIAILAVTFFGLNWFSTNVSPLLSNFFKSQQQQQQQVSADSVHYFSIDAHYTGYVDNTWLNICVYVPNAEPATTAATATSAPD